MNDFVGAIALGLPKNFCSVFLSSSFHGAGSFSSLGACVQTRRRVVRVNPFSALPLFWTPLGHQRFYGERRQQFRVTEQSEFGMSTEVLGRSRSLLNSAHGCAESAKATPGGSLCNIMFGRGEWRASTA